jgi:peptidoglycan hydrolase-like protein with peptidoglycan-binding domain/D-alanyl-D-alanine dipeptidase
MTALEFNESQNFDTATIKRIQRTVGSTADGTWGRRTVAALQRWQQSKGLSADGKCGQKTVAALEAAWAQDDQPDDGVATDDRRDDKDRPLEADDDGETIEFTRVGTGFGYFDRNVDLDSTSKGDDVLALFNDLFAFGFTNDPPKSEYGKTGSELVAAFQQAATTPHRIDTREYRRIQVPVTFTPDKSGVVDAATRAEIRRWKEQRLRWQTPDTDFVERRVRVKKLGSLPYSSALLVEIPGRKGVKRKLHRLAAPALLEMVKACQSEIGVLLEVSSGWRPRRWKTREAYEKDMIAKYGSVAKGSLYMAYESPHETGLCVDFGTGGLEANSSTIAQQKQTPAYAWLVANAYRFGFCPYAREPWHWEFPLSSRAWTTGESDWRLRDEDV